MRTIRRRATVALGAAGLIVAGAGGIAGATTAPTEPATGDSGGGAVDYMWTPNPDAAGGCRGRGRHRRLGRLRRGRLDRSGRRLGHPVRGPHRVRGQHPDRQHQRRDGAADAERRVRRRVGLGRRHRAADGRRRGGPDRRRRVLQLPADLRRPQAAAVELPRRRAVRHPPRPRRQPARVQHRHVRRRRPGFVERDVRRRHAGRRQDLGVRQPDLHRRRRGVPDGHPARPRHHQRLRPRRRPARRRRGPARGAEAAHRPVLGG